jgi:predicted metal-dependent hydrolase
MSKVTIVRSNRRSLAMHVEPNGTLLIKAPNRISMRDIQGFINSHSDWIKKQTEKLAKHPVIKKKFIDGEEYLYLGNSYKLKIGNYKTIEPKTEFLQFPKFLEFRIEKELTNWYEQQAKDVITRRLEVNTKLMGVEFTSVYFSDTISKWGSCSPENVLQFNWRLIMAPLLVLNYVVVHELAHTIHKNHSQRFWTKVASVNPSFKQQIKWLREHGHILTTQI